MVICLPVKFEFDCVFELESGNKNVDGQTDQQNYTNFERNLAMMVIYVPVKFEFDWTNCFRVKSPETKMWTNRWMDKQTKNGQMNRRNFTNFKRILATMVIYLPIKFEFDWTNRFRVRVRKRKMWRDRRTSDTSI